MRPGAELIEDFAGLLGAPGFTATLEWEKESGPWLLGLREHTFALYSPGRAAFHFDREGRLRRAFFPGESRFGVHYLRGLDGALLRKGFLEGDRSGGLLPGFRSPGGSERWSVLFRAHQAATLALESFPGAGADESPREHEAAEEAHDLLRNAAAFDPDRLEREGDRFLEAYRPLGILPPDQYRALILQATEGCAHDGCAFCTLYRGRRHRVKTPEEFRDHVARVKRFLGRALPLRRGVFLGEANALAVPQARLREFFQVIREDFAEVEPLAKGTASFIDAFTPSDKGPREYRELVELGLRRVYLGIESGDDELLRFLRKPAASGDAAALVRDLKLAGVSVGAIILAGAGGDRFRVSHVERSVELLESLPLDAEDVIYLSPLVVDAGGDYETRSLDRGIRPLAPDELAEQERELARRLRSALGEDGPTVTRYDVRGFVYY